MECSRKSNQYNINSIVSLVSKSKRHLCRCRLIAKSKPGIKQVYAINAGREIRVIANAKLINDDEAVLLAKEIAQEIESKVQYPGEIKVNVIRELRAIDFAR